MGEIIQFRPKYCVNKSQDAKKFKAMSKGRYEEFVCNDCNCIIEVIDDDFPKYCPGCNKEIEW